MESSKHTLSSIGAHTARHSSRQKDSKAESALSALQDKTKFDLVITDCQLPGLGGLAFMMMLREKMPAVPVIIITGHGNIDVYIEAMSLGAFEYICKPVSAVELIRIVSTALACCHTDDKEKAFMRMRGWKAPAAIIAKYNNKNVIYGIHEIHRNISI
jgi:DNA-binding NtrC family response regulator